MTGMTETLQERARIAGADRLPDDPPSVVAMCDLLIDLADALDRAEKRLKEGHIREAAFVRWKQQVTSACLDEEPCRHFGGELHADGTCYVCGRVPPTAADATLEARDDRD